LHNGLLNRREAFAATLLFWQNASIAGDARVINSVWRYAMSDSLQGGCACGQVRYKSVAAPAFSLLCQCRQCQRITGSGHAAQFAVPAESTKIHGEVKYFRFAADSGNAVDSGFCPVCGNPILKKTSGFPQFLFFHASTLDDPAAFNPQMVVWSKSRQAWDHVNPALPLRQ
jgi:hypothetical protein